ncbi:MAG: phosphate ABC transporter substrate-binding protein PstS [Anaerolineales bacterium]|nr:phosphate ABC transporter substrate-binding protein PstS [Anaerolineales bacterium]MCB9111868.1 phosphate ABC transporter substrate-binding protein PstS [Anaerolineales bacterium]
MSKITRSFMFVLLALAFVLAACGGNSATPETIVQTQIVEKEVTAQPAMTEEPLPAGSVQINGAGATFPLPIYTEWTYAYSYVDPAVVINYQGIGSGGGKKAIIDGTVDFAGSDSLLKAEEYDAGKDLQMYPMVASAVVVIYNVAYENVPDGTTPAKLVLDRQTLVDIFNGKVNNWTDPAIVELNPDLKDFLPNATITVVHRSDGSGTTEIFTKSLTAFSSDWTAGGASSVEWPVDQAGNGVGGKGNQGVSAAVINTPNSLGYVEISFAKSNGLAFADLINKSGNKVTASAESIASDMATFGPEAFDDKLTATIVDGDGAGDYPIVGYTYLILHTESMTDCVKAGKLLEYVQWTLTDASAAKRAGDLGYAVLPGAVRDAVLAKLGEVTCNGEPVMK